MKNILFIDDETYINQQAVQLMQLKGYKVVFISSISESIRFFENEFSSIGLILLDIMIGLKDRELKDNSLIKETESGYSAGIYLYKYFTRLMNEKGVDIPIVFFTARFNIENEVSGDLKEVTTLIKPIEPKILIDKIESVLNS